ncbi:MAG: tRNA pseudouridine(38-40) synthase TruA [Microbacteriaceae bacterium]
MQPDTTIRLRLDISYDGSQFSGWSTQPTLRTVQGALEDALATVVRSQGDAPRLTVAGRTDAGVHALGQVAHLDLNTEQWESLEDLRRGKRTHPPQAKPDTLRRRLNGIAGLDADVHVSRIAVAPPGFDARFSATWRRYEYRIADSLSLRSPLERGHTVWYPAELDVAGMNAAAASLIGLHDWASYCKPREGATTIRTLQEFDWNRQQDGVLTAHLRADAFCHSMVRALVGASVAVGEGKLRPEDLVDLRDARVRTSAFKVMPAKGLALVEVGYPDDDQLASRAEQTRARRDHPVTP